MAFSGFQDFNPDFSSALQQMIAARPGISINSGYRSPERQAQLFAAAVAKYGSEEKARHWVAPPGHSMHNKGLGADLGFATDADRAWAHENAQKFGLNFRMGHEPWHIELVGGKPTPVNEQGGVVTNPQPEAQVQAPERRERLAIPGPKITLNTAPVDPNFNKLPPLQDVNSLANMMSSQSEGSAAKQLVNRIRSYG